MKEEKLPHTRKGLHWKRRGDEPVSEACAGFLVGAAGSCPLVGAAGSCPSSGQGRVRGCAYGAAVGTGRL